MSILPVMSTNEVLILNQLERLHFSSILYLRRWLGYGGLKNQISDIKNSCDSNLITQLRIFTTGSMRPGPTGIFRRSIMRVSLIKEIILKQFNDESIV